jgi:hypothetical protein
MKLKLDFSVPKNVLELSHEDSIVMLGSCFSDEMSEHFLNSGYRVLSNLFGTLFHPTAIANVVKSSISGDSKVHLLQQDDLFFSWDSAHKLFGQSESEIIELINSKRVELKSRVLEGNLLVFTFGTAWSYRLNETGRLVGNCHKKPQDLFTKELSDVGDLINIWQVLLKELFSLNPKLQIVFTASPVRHIKDGVVENNRSKARLIELIHALVESNERTFYFPSYEILIDELRDYRFYAEDLVHPSKQAVAYIWDCFEKFAFDDETININNEVRSVNRSLNHRRISLDYDGDRMHLKKIENKKQDLTAKHPSIFWK